MCRQFPLQLVVTDRGAAATVARSCPSAAADLGRPLEEHLPFLRRLLKVKLAEYGDCPRRRRSRVAWPAAGTISICSPTRSNGSSWIAACHLCGGLSMDSAFVRWWTNANGIRITGDAVAELVAVLERSAPDDVGQLFQDRQPPSRSAGRLFRRLGAHFVRCVPGGRPTRTWLDHWRVLRLSGQLARSQQPRPRTAPALSSNPRRSARAALGTAGRRRLAAAPPLLRIANCLPSGL